MKVLTENKVVKFYLNNIFSLTQPKGHLLIYFSEEKISEVENLKKLGPSRNECRTRDSGSYTKTGKIFKLRIPNQHR